MSPQAPVLLLHGMGCGPWVWREVAPRLSDLDLRTVTLAGHRGGIPVRLDAGPAAEQMVEEVERWLDGAGIDCAHIVGNSLGGWVALRLAERGRAVSVLCLAPAGGWLPGAKAERALMARFALGRRIARRAETLPAMLATEPVRRALMHPVVARRETCTFQNMRSLIRDLAHCQALELAHGEPSARRMGAIAAVDVPTTIAWSAKDRVLNGNWARVRYEDLPARTEVLPGVGHLPMLDDPAAVAALITSHVAEADRTAMT